MTNDDEPARRAYWSDQMDQGYAFIEQLAKFPVEECGEGFASIVEAAQSAGIEMQFAATKIAGDLDRCFYARASLVADIIALGRSMNERGWVLKIEDGFRSVEMQTALVCKPEVFDAILAKCIWECDGKAPTVEFMFRRATVLVANSPKIGTHMSGSAIDISVFDRTDGRELSRGGSYLEMSERTPMRSPFVPAEDRQRRLQITALMEAYGFMHFPFEFWHYNKGDGGAHLLGGNPAPARYGPVHWDERTNRVTPVPQPSSPLVALPQLQQAIEAALGRAAG